MDSIKEEKRLEYMDDEKHESYMREVFKNEMRTDHKGIMPAKDRIRQYKTRFIKPSTAAPGGNARRELNFAQSQPAFKVMPGSAKDGKDNRPVTAATVGMSEATTAAS